MASSAEEKQQLKQLVNSIITAQGNVFIKELLRKKKALLGGDKTIVIGATKADFIKNLGAAIDQELITRDDIESWLAEVAGWGNQHVYLYPAPAAQAADRIEQQVRQSPHRHLLVARESITFPETLELTSIVVAPDRLTLAWHRSNVWWTRAKDKDRELEEGPDRYELRAYLEHLDRSVVRFEWQYDRPYCALFVQLPLDDPAYEAVFENAWAALKDIGVIGGPLRRVLLSEAVKAIGNQGGTTIARATTWRTDGGYVDIFAEAEGGIAQVGPIARARKGIDQTEFAGADGRFEMPSPDGVLPKMTLKLQLFGTGGLLRIGVQCPRDHVYWIMNEIWKHATP